MGRRNQMHSLPPADKRCNAIFGKEDMNFLFQDLAQGGARRADTIIHPTTVCLNHAKTGPIANIGTIQN